MPDTILLPRVLLTNDDGIDAEGIKVLEEIAHDFAEEVWIVAPEHNQSGASQSVSLSRPIKAWRRNERLIAIDGSPSDCVVLALSHFMSDNQPSLILSGVNAGKNIGEDVNLSGTIGACMTGLILGVPGIAISQAYAGKNKMPWNTTRAVLPKVLKHLLLQGWKKDTCLSVNIPDAKPQEITGFSWARQTQKSVETITATKRSSPDHEDYFWLIKTRKTPVHAMNSEVAIMRRNEVAVTALSPDRSVDIAKPSVSFHDAAQQDNDQDLAV